MKQTLLSLAIAGALSAAGLSAHAAATTPAAPAAVKHVLLISVDGLHQNDLNWFVANNPNSNLAKLAAHGAEYLNALTTFPSDSFPGMVAQVTGGTPKTTGVYYDDEYNHDLLPMGTSQSDCENGVAKTGAEVYYAEVVENTNANGDFSLDAYQGIANLYPLPNFAPGDLTNVPTGILKLMGGADDIRTNLINPATLPVDPQTCDYVYPHEYLQVNTVFEVARSHGMRTAWSDKHIAYEILNGPSGYGIDDMFSPEINSNVDITVAGGNDWTKDNVNTQQYDTFKVMAVVNQINGYDHSGVNKPGVPGIFGMNFQSVSTAQKLNTSTTTLNTAAQYVGGQSAGTQALGGYVTDSMGNTVPGPVLVSALNFVDNSLGQMVAAINANTDTAGNTAIIVSAKHGQSPQKRSDLTIVNDGTMTDQLNAAWQQSYPSAAQPLVAHAMDDDGVLLWLNDRSKQATDFAKKWLMAYTTGASINNGTVTVPAGVGSDANGNQISKNFTSAGLQTIYGGADAANFIGAVHLDPRVPDLIGIAQVGTVWAGGKLSKIAEHGGNATYDRHVPIIVWGPGVAGKKVSTNVTTTQIAPTILHMLGLNPNSLQAVVREGTKVLP